ncbi:hypothetical protein DYB32_001779 [Aphanomyces invadans]|uniref:Uncharacterized protein n=1 Tax=Aphanomyces invadans TaxID=157072 RepID=A0A418B542_9STRA|nr:hypothetical protein DYB32_001779 [Aphanomyces invadans]
MNDLGRAAYPLWSSDWAIVEHGVLLLWKDVWTLLQRPEVDASLFEHVMANTKVWSTLSSLLGSSNPSVELAVVHCLFGVFSAPEQSSRRLLQRQLQDQLVATHCIENLCVKLISPYDVTDPTSQQTRELAALTMVQICKLPHLVDREAALKCITFCVENSMACLEDFEHSDVFVHVLAQYVLDPESPPHRAEVGMTLLSACMNHQPLICKVLVDHGLLHALSPMLQSSTRLQDLVEQGCVLLLIQRKPSAFLTWLLAELNGQDGSSYHHLASVVCRSNNNLLRMNVTVGMCVASAQTSSGRLAVNEWWTYIEAFLTETSNARILRHVVRHDGSITFANKLGFHANMTETVVSTSLAVVLTMLLFAGAIVSNGLEVYIIMRHRQSSWTAAFQETQLYYNFTRDRLPTLRTLIFVPWPIDGGVCVSELHATAAVGFGMVGFDNHLCESARVWCGYAHAHHLIDHIRSGRPVRTAVAIVGTFSSTDLVHSHDAVFQFLYTTVFGIFASFVFLRTGTVSLRQRPSRSHVDHVGTFLGHFTAVFGVHSFCNLMGFPDLSFLSTDHPLHSYKPGAVCINPACRLTLW